MLRIQFFAAVFLQCRGKNRRNAAIYAERLVHRKVNALTFQLKIYAFVTFLKCEQFIPSHWKTEFTLLSFIACSPPWSWKLACVVGQTFSLAIFENMNWHLTQFLWKVKCISYASFMFCTFWWDMQLCNFLMWEIARHSKDNYEQGTALIIGNCPENNDISGFAQFLWFFGEAILAPPPEGRRGSVFLSKIVTLVSQCQYHVRFLDYLVKFYSYCFVLDPFVVLW